jgi:hypothetical protein
MSLQREVSDISERQRRRLEDLQAVDVDFRKEVDALESRNSELEAELAAVKGRSEKKEEELENELRESQRKLQALVDKRRENNAKLEKEQSVFTDLKSMMEGIQAGIGRIEVKMEYLGFQSDKLSEKFGTSVGVVLEAIFEEGEVKCPTSFLILPFPVGDPNFAPKMESWMDKFGSISVSLQESLQQQNGDLQAEAAANANADSGSKTLQQRVDSLKDRASDFLQQYTSQKSYLYLLDEVTGEVVVGDRYPIEIKEASDLVKKYLPMMRVSINAVYALNCIGSIAHMVGVPVPTLPEKFTNAAEKCVSEASKESSVEEFKVLQSKLDELGGGDAGQTPEVRGARGRELREIEAFLLENDPKPSRFCELRRVCDKTSGKAVWTTDKGLKALERKYSESPNGFHHLQGSVETQVLQNRETATSSSSSVKTDSTFAAKSLLSEELLSLLIELNLEEFGPVLCDKYGVKDVGDLKYLNEAHLDGIGVRLVQREKLKEKVTELNSVQTSDELKTSDELRLPKRKCVIS